MKFKKIYFEYILVGIVALTTTLANCIQIITQWLKNPPGRMFAGIAHYYADYFFYISQMAQGINGRLLFADHLFSNEPTRTTWIYWFNVILGWIGGRFGLNAFAVYDISLLLLTLFLTILWYVVAYKLYPSNRFKRLLTFFFVITVSSFFNLTEFFQSRKIVFDEQYWFSPHLTFVRFGGVPHQLFQTICFILMVLFVSQRFKSASTKNYLPKAQDSFIKVIFENFKGNKYQYIILFILSLIATSATPIQMMIFLSALGLFILWDYISSKKININHIIVMAIILSAAVPTSLLLLQEFNIPVYSYGRIWENQIPVIVSLWQFLYYIGPAVLFIPFGIWIFIKRQDSFSRLFFLYGICSILIFFSPIPKLMKNPPPRFLHPAPYSIIGIISASGLIQLSKYLNKLTRIPRIFYYILFISIYTFFTVPALYSQISSRADPAIQNPVMLLTTDWNHIPYTTVEAFSWLKKQKNPSDKAVVIVDSKFRYEILIPVLSGKVVFSGHPVLTLFYHDKEKIRDQVFNASLTAVELKKIFSDHRIGWIVTSVKTNPLDYFDRMNFLKKVHENEVVIIYQVIF